MAGRAQPLPLLDHCLRTVNSPLGTSTRPSEVWSLSWKRKPSPLAFLFPPSPYFGPYLPGRTCYISLIPQSHLPSLSLISSALAVVISFWLTSSLASFLPFSVGSLEKLCALRGEHPFYTRAKRERTHTCERAASSSLSPHFFSFFFGISRSPLRDAYVCSYIYA